MDGATGHPVKSARVVGHGAVSLIPAIELRIADASRQSRRIEVLKRLTDRATSEDYVLLRGSAMSSFVELAPGEYSPTAFNAFHPSASNFEIGNARALMWLSQLAYESHRKPTIETVSGEWEFSSATGFINQKIDIAGSFETCGLIGERADAVILAFREPTPVFGKT